MGSCSTTIQPELNNTTCNTTSIPHQFNDNQYYTHQTDTCNLDDCSAMTRIKYILNHNDEDLIKYGTYEFINHSLKQHNNTHLIDDYHHLMFIHEHEFEKIYNILTDNTSKCYLTKCQSFARNHRDRSDIKSKLQYRLFANKSYDVNSYDIKQVNIVQIIDQIHCYFLHTFDCYHKLTQEQELKLSTCNVETRLREISKHRNSLMQHKEQQTRINRYSVKSKDKYAIFSEDLKLNDNNEKKEEKYNVYSFGVRFEYDKSEKLKQWYVKPKWNKLKMELISNSYEAFNIEQWNELYEKAKDFRKSKRIKEDCIYEPTGDTPGTNKKHKRIMSIAHLISVILYCNFDQLQSRFSASYRKNKNENDSDFKNRHSEWHQLGKYLREVVEIYGIKILSKSQKSRSDFSLYNTNKLQFYHGINQEMVFVSTKANICGPLSTSSDIVVASNFAGYGGLLLELSGTHARYFDCCGISDYSNEKEKFFLGGYDALVIETVMNPRHDAGVVDYRTHITAMHIILSMFNGETYYSNSGEPFSDEICDIVCTLLFDKTTNIDPYVQNLFNSYAKNVVKITIDWLLMNTICDIYDETAKGYKFIKHRLCMDKFECIQMDKIIPLFERLQVIELKHITLQSNVFDYMLGVLKRHSNDSRINKIVICDPNQEKGLKITHAYTNVRRITNYEANEKTRLKKPETLTIYDGKFIREIGWKLYLQDEDNLSICRIS
eukprot:225912_1